MDCEIEGQRLVGIRGDRARCHRAFRASLFSATALLVVMGVSEPARAQLQLPQLTVTAAKKRPPQPRRARPRLVTAPAR
ncbi:MAG TPA: hypothetical protein VGJ20_35950, partial [Xanthobacteraceae bacterium]